MEGERYLTMLTDHPNQNVFNAAQSVWELFNYYDNEFGDMDLCIEDPKMEDT